MRAAGSDAEVMQIGRNLIEWAAFSIEVLAVIVIVGAIITAVSLRGFLRTRASPGQMDVFGGYRQRIGRGLLLGLELLLAADVIDTVILRPDVESLAALGLLVLIRTFLSWSLQVEIDGRWPWRAKVETRNSANETTPAPASSDRES